MANTVTSNNVVSNVIHTEEKDLMHIMNHEIGFVVNNVVTWFGDLFNHANTSANTTK